MKGSHTVKTLAGVDMPRLIYGTAWKKSTTTALVAKAISLGFRGIDTACQPKHYQEPLVGQALVNVYQSLGIKREDLFLQTKFTSVDGQDPQNIPYDSHAALPDQVRQSVQASLRNLQTTYIDSLVMHSPMRTHKDTMIVWGVFEEFHDQGLVKQLGISNIYNPDAFKRIFEEARVKPAIVQNRFYADSGYDVELRSFCRHHGVIYQSFWTLTANPHIIKSHVVQELAKKRHATAEQIFFRFVIDLGIAPLTGTSSERHMKEDLEAMDMEPLGSQEVAQIEQLMIREFSGHMH